MRLHVRSLSVALLLVGAFVLVPVPSLAAGPALAEDVPCGTLWPEPRKNVPYVAGRAGVPGGPQVTTGLNADDKGRFVEGMLAPVGELTVQATGFGALTWQLVVASGTSAGAVVASGATTTITSMGEVLFSGPTPEAALCFVATPGSQVTTSYVFSFSDERNVDEPDCLVGVSLDDEPLACVERPPV